jgi:hypothetical protein
MGANTGRYSFFAAIILIIAAAAIVFFWRSKNISSFSIEDDKFVTVYIEMAVASEMAGNNLDSLNLFYERIFNSNGVDSSWMFDYVSKISYDAEKHKLIWDSIVEKLDSLRKNSGPDSVAD